MIRLGFVTLGVLLAGAGAARAGNLLSNGGFESPVLGVGASLTVSGGSMIGAPGWTVEGVDVLVLQTAYAEVGNGINAFNAQEGLNSLDLTGAGNTGPTNGVIQTVATDVGRLYQLSFFVGRASGNALYATPATIELSINDGSRLSFTNSDSTPGRINWRQFTTTFSATSTSTKIAFYNATPLQTSEAGLDDVVLSAVVPEPGTLGLALVGLVAVSVAIRRRG